MEPMTTAIPQKSASTGTISWQMAGLVGVAIAISYLDRQTLPVAIQAIEKDIPLSNEGFALLQSAFLLAYAVMYAGGGRFLDVVGTKLGFFIIMLFWSLACASHGLAINLTTLVLSRLLLGMGEGGGFPAATRVVAEWFEAKESSTAMGLINAGTAVGAVLAPPLIALTLIFANWRWVFFLTGGLGLFWSAWWWCAYFPKKDVRDERAVETTHGELRWVELFQYRQVWGLVAAKFLSDAAWYFYLFWLPKYLYDARGFDIKAIGTFAWIPYAASGVGSLCGGMLSSWLLSQKCSLNFARKAALGASAILMPCILLVQQVPVGWALALFSVAYFGQQSWSTLVMTLPTDLFPKNIVGSVAGLVGFGGAMGGFTFGPFVGYLLDHGYGYGTVFMLAGSFHLIAYLILLAAIPSIGLLTINQPLKLSGRPLSQII
jgi:ACS family hexuronate transporter-like MFS transporter